LAEDVLSLWSKISESFVEECEAVEEECEAVDVVKPHAEWPGSVVVMVLR
jgi:hypothetical protein